MVHWSKVFPCQTRSVFKKTISIINADAAGAIWHLAFCYRPVAILQRPVADLVDGSELDTATMAPTERFDIIRKLIGRLPSCGKQHITQRRACQFATHLLSSSAKLADIDAPRKSPHHRSQKPVPDVCLANTGAKSYNGVPNEPNWSPSLRRSMRLSQP